MIPALVTAGPSLPGYFLTGPNPDLRAAHRPIGVSLSIEYGASRRTGAITGNSNSTTV